jgi:hypothetical protein
MRYFTSTFLILITVIGLSQSSNVGDSIYGDFDGDGIKEYAFAVQTEKGYGNAIENGVPGTYSVFFSSEQIAEIPVGCCEIKLINEGDLNGDGADDLSIYQAPMNGNSYWMKSLSWSDTTWNTIVPAFMIPTAGVSLTDEELQDRVFTEGGLLFYFETDMNDENFGLIKRRVFKQK